MLRDVAFAKRGEPQPQAYAILALGRVGDRESLDELSKMLGSSGTRAILRRAAATAIAAIAEPEDWKAQAALMEASRNDPDLPTRDAAILGLGEIRHGRVARHLLKLFHESVDTARPTVALALGIQGDPKAAPAIRKELASTGDWRRRGAYSLSLGLLGDLASAPMLEKEFHRCDIPEVKGRIALALALMGSVPSADLFYEAAGASDRPRLRVNLSVAMALLGDRRGASVLTSMLTQDKSVAGRLSGAVTLGVLRWFEAAPKLVDAYRNPRNDPSVRVYALVGLGILADPQPVPKLARMAADGHADQPLPSLREVLSIL